MPEPELIDEQRWQRLLGAAAHSRFPCRDRSLLHLFWSCGATVSQICALEPQHVRFLSGRLRWPDGRESLVPPDALHALTAYVSLERHSNCPKLFCGRHGRPIGPADLDRLFRRLSAATGFPVDPRLLRRSGLLHLLRAAPLRTLALRRGSAAALRRESQP